MSKDETIAKRRNEGLADARRYAQGPLRRALRWPSGPIELKAPEAGIHSLLYFAGPRDGDTRQAMIRAFDKPKRRSLYRWALAVSQRFDLPTPRLLYCGPGWLEKLRFGNRYVTTTVAPGRPLDDQPHTDRMRRAVACAVARLHRAERPRWGEPAWRPRSRSYSAQYRQGIERRLAQMAAHPSVEPLRAWFAPHLDRLEQLKVFQLCHLHLHGDDILYDPESDRATAIDCVSLQFNRASCDLPNLRLSSWMGGEENWRDFLETYLEESPSERRAEYETETPFYEAYLYLRRVGKHAERQARHDGAQREEFTQNLQDLLRVTGISSTA